MFDIFEQLFVEIDVQPPSVYVPMFFCNVFFLGGRSCRFLCSFFSQRVFFFIFGGWGLGFLTAGYCVLVSVFFLIYLYFTLFIFIFLCLFFFIFFNFFDFIIIIIVIIIFYFYFVWLWGFARLGCLGGRGSWGMGGWADRCPLLLLFNV